MMEANSNSSPSLLLLPSLKKRQVTEDEINSFFSRNSYPLYQKADPTINQLNLFFKDIGFDIPEFYKCWFQFVKFLNGMPGNLNDITMVTR